MPERGKYRSSQEKFVNEASNHSCRYQLEVKNPRIHKETKHERVQAGGKNMYTQKNQTHGMIRYRICVLKDKIRNLRYESRDFPGDPVVKILCPRCRGQEFDPWSETKIRHAMGMPKLRQKEINEK